jgi:hypothetical protein
MLCAVSGSKTRVCCKYVCCDTFIASDSPHGMIGVIFYVSCELHKLRGQSVKTLNSIKKTKSIFISKILFISQL